MVGVFRIQHTDCAACGGTLIAHPTLPNRLQCPHCRREYDTAAAERQTESMAELFDDAKRERIHNLRRKLYAAEAGFYPARLYDEEAERALRELHA